MKKKFENNSKIQQDSLIYNIKKMLRIQKKREQLIINKMIKPDEMIKYVRKRNEINILLEKSKKIKNLRVIAKLIEQEIQNQNNKINDVI